MMEAERSLTATARRNTAVELKPPDGGGYLMRDRDVRLERYLDWLRLPLRLRP